MPICSCPGWLRAIPCRNGSCKSYRWNMARLYTTVAEMPQPVEVAAVKCMRNMLQYVVKCGVQSRRVASCRKNPVCRRFLPLFRSVIEMQAEPCSRVPAALRIANMAIPAATWLTNSSECNFAITQQHMRRSMQSLRHWMQLRSSLC